MIVRATENTDFDAYFSRQRARVDVYKLVYITKAWYYFPLNIKRLYINKEWKFQAP
jgi:hypothetical protein